MKVKELNPELDTEAELPNPLSIMGLPKLQRRAAMVNPDTGTRQARKAWHPIPPIPI